MIDAEDAPKVELEEGQRILVRAAKYLDKRWKSTPIRSADINDKLACDKLLWIVHNYHEPKHVGYVADANTPAVRPEVMEAFERSVARNSELLRLLA